VGAVADGEFDLERELDWGIFKWTCLLGRRETAEWIAEVGARRNVDFCNLDRSLPVDLVQSAQKLNSGQCGKIETFKWLYGKADDRTKECALLAAAAYGSLELLQWVVKKTGASRSRAGDDVYAGVHVRRFEGAAVDKGEL
jgi:hypothetical protein